MAPRKLSDSDKSEIVDLYREPGQTTSTLAEQYGVSNSTISRILKNAIPSDEYSELISQKRMTGSDKAATKSATPTRRKKKKSAANTVVAKEQPTGKTVTVPEVEPAHQPTADDAPLSESPQKASGPKLKSTAKTKRSAKNKAAENTEEKTPTRRRRRRSRATDEDTGQLPLLGQEADAAETEEETEDAPQKSAPVGRPKPILASQRAEDLEEEDDDDDEDDLLGLDDTLGDDFGDDDLEEEEDDDDEDDDGADLPIRRTSSEAAVEIMPLGDAVLPKPCYLVIDMRAELITRPLVEFADLGKIPSSEEREKTLPVFDNHRVARRFSRNKQRVIKVPDGSLITRTSPYLTAKGITRLLVDGQVFDLAGVD